uniref:CULT domain-containing protein n=1 Tax=Meloidogyne enterolobii TaxID=390850 RepID=A0A6V7XL01_MELEN|nr:unnamed protein product [Meloidogyne enterolobii]CAD2204801.1 unnamed protein product [Meloidogyne enterolobii]
MNLNNFSSLWIFLLIFINILTGSLTFADLLCRYCGHSVTTASALINVKSPAAYDNWNLTVLGVETIVQTFKNSVPETYNLIFANGADLKFSGKAQTAETWFEGMSWRPCVCSACNTHIGWYFQSPEKDFVGLVIDNLISEDYVDTLTKVPLPQKQISKDAESKGMVKMNFNLFWNFY